MSQVKRLDNINALRAIAALSVCWFHFTWHSDIWGNLFPDGSQTKTIGYWGLQGVYIFFVISGFVIPLSLQHARYKVKYFFRFIAKRLARLHPPYLMSMIVLGLAAVIYGLKDGHVPDAPWARIGHHLLFTAPFFDVHWIQDVYWTLSVEFQYYLIIGLIIPLFLLEQTWLRILVWIAFVYSAVPFDHDQKYIFFFHAPVFAMGIALWWHHTGKLKLSELVYLLCIASAETWYELGPETMAACIFTCVIILFVHWRDKVTQWLGDISYSVYLTHGFTGGQFLWFFSHYAQNNIQRYGLLFVALTLTVLFAHFFYKWIEVPSVNWSKKIAYNKQKKIPLPE